MDRFSPTLIVVALLLVDAQAMGGRILLPASIAEQESLCILVTDSGLGGLSICARIEHELQERHPFVSVRMIYCNALGDVAYNQMTDGALKAATFSRALRGMTDRFHPDLVLIACNTLSVLYPRTEFAQSARLPVIGIVELGVELIAEALFRDPASTAVVFGTETTIGERSHLLQLVARGIDSSRIVVESCPGLAGEIQSDPSSDIVQSFIGMFVADAVSTLERSRRIVAALCCTHYGYCSGMFAAAIAGEGYQAEIVNPNDRMAELLFPSGRDGRFSSTRAALRVVSRVVLSEEERTGIAALLRPDAPLTADALVRYELLTDLF